MVLVVRRTIGRAIGGLTGVLRADTLATVLPELRSAHSDAAVVASAAAADLLRGTIVNRTKYC